LKAEAFTSWVVLGEGRLREIVGNERGRIGNVEV
jgi:hypothetical protein